MNDLNLPFREIWLVDFEFSASEGNRPVVICLVAREFLSGRQVRVWQDELTKLAYPPYPCDESSLFVAYYSSAEFNCHLVLGWPLPVRVLDLFCEFRNLTNGLSPPCGSGLLGALAWLGMACPVSKPRKKTTCAHWPCGVGLGPVERRRP